MPTYFACYQFDRAAISDLQRTASLTWCSTASTTGSNSGFGQLVREVVGSCYNLYAICIFTLPWQC
ncbi:MAG: hypothetical protein OSA51_10605, partial [Octadecabacter sp.]|nr:hypothetical protein [Octadecabacter sp.]